jgi:DNA modification methylase
VDLKLDNKGGIKMEYKFLTQQEVMENHMEIVANTLVQGDCLELMKYIPEKSIDMILCDLPYG